MRKIVIAIDSFKGTLTSRQAGEAAAHGVADAMPAVELSVVPVADGGEGTVQAVITGLGGEMVECNVQGPLGETVKSSYGLCGDMAVIEIAAASGLTLIKAEQRNPWLTSSYGTGELIRDALLRGCRNILIGLGGSATNDAGFGMLSALGYRFLDANGCELTASGGACARVASIDDSAVLPQLKEARFTVACDVNNPLTGPYGASHVFGPQKGADAAMIAKLDGALSYFANVTASYLGHDFSNEKGAGAAGGLGFAIKAYLRGSLTSGVDMVLDALRFNEIIRDADLIITGEGRRDGQTCMGKTPGGVLRRGIARNIPVIAVGGSVDETAIEELMNAGFSAVFPIVAGPLTLQEAMKPEVASRNLQRTVAQLLRAISLRI